MPSRWTAIAIAALVVLAGCPALGSDGGGSTETPTREPPDYHELALTTSNDGDPYEVTVAVTRDGETVLEQSFESTETHAYHTLTTLDETGSYEVTVNTTIPLGRNDTLDEQLTVDGDPGEATVLTVSKERISTETLDLPRRPIGEPVRVRPLWNSGNQFPINVTTHVWYRGERVGSETVTFEAGDTEPEDRLVESLELERAGVYHVAARVPRTGATPEGGEWTNETVLVTESTPTVVAAARYVRADVRWIRAMNVSSS